MRRDRLLLVSAFAMALLTLLGTVGESLGMHRLLKSNTSKARSHSLFRQGCMLYDLIPNMPERRLVPLVERFAQAVSEESEFSGLFTSSETRGLESAGTGYCIPHHTTMVSMKSALLQSRALSVCPRTSGQFSAAYDPAASGKDHFRQLLASDARQPKL
jgi:hypothetical protein